MNLKNRFLVPFLMCLALWLTAGSAQGQGFGVGNYQVLSSTRVGRTEFEYVIGVTISNQVASALGVTAQVFSVSTNTVIIQGSVNFGDVALGASAFSTNTITIRQNRLAPFNPADLQWFVTVNSMPLSLTVISPVSGFLTNGTNVVVSGTIGPAVDGVLIGRSTAALNGTNFSGTFPLEEGRNTISVLASNIYGGSGLINVFVTRDTTPPILNIETPTNGTVLAARQVTVSGLVNDAVPGTVNPEQASVMVNGLSAMILNRSFSISDVLLVPGTNTITAIARDRAGNENQKQIQLVFIDPASQKHLVPLAGDSQTAIVGTMLPQPLLVELVDGDGVVQTNQPVTFTVTRNDGILFASPDSGRNLSMLTDDKGQAKVLFQLGTRTGVGNNQVVVTSPGVNGQLQFEANAVGALPAKISPLIPETQVGEVGKPLPQPWTAYATDSGGNPVAGAPIIFTVSQGGGNLGGATTVSTNTDSDGRAFVTLTLGPDEGINNNVVFAGSPGVTNSSAVFTASGQTPGAVNATRVVGLVLDNANRPMSNILCVIANTTQAAVTDQQGQFAISRAPVGAIRLIVDAQNRGYPGEWHALTFNMVTVAGHDNSLDRPIYMVQVDSDSAAVAGGDQDVTLHLKDFPGATLTVFAHSLRNDQGQPITNRVTWTQVNAERIPMAPPQGSQPILTTAILPTGMRFNPPARMCIPNSGLPPGQILELYGFDHDIGSFVSVGTATVSSDGSMICSDPGFGIVKSGWHPFVPPPPPCTPVCGPAPADTPCVKYVTIPPVTKCDCPTYIAHNAKILTLNADVNGLKQISICTNDPVNFSAAATAEYCDSGLEYEWDFGDGSAKVKSAATTHNYTKSGHFTATVTAKCTACPSAQKSSSITVEAGPFSFITVATTPTEQERTTIGTCEEVDITACASTATWTVTGGGTVDPDSGASTLFTAPEAPGACTVTATFAGGGTHSVTFTVIKPSGVSMTKFDEIASPAGTQGAGMHTDILITPTNVSFYNIQIEELPGPASSVTGYFTNYPAASLVHNPWGTNNSNWVGVNQDNTVKGRDEASFSGYPPPWYPGGWDWIIPWNYRCLGTAGNGSLIVNVTQSFRMTGTNGASTVTKAGASVSRTP